MSTQPYTLHGTTAVIRLDNPPVNGMSYDLRCRFIAALDEAEADFRVCTILVIGSDKVFSGGADITEFASPQALREPNLPTLVNSLEACTKPTIAAIGGLCMGGGLELALGCHYRVAQGNAQLSLPEIKLGLMPGAGGTQRLPRLIGVETALNLILGGNPVAAGSLRGTFLIDEFIDDDLLVGALAFAARVTEAGGRVRRVCDLPAPALEHEALLLFARDLSKTGTGSFLAAQSAVDAVEAAVTQSFNQGLALEQSLFWQLMGTSESRALRHAFTAERACAKIPGITGDTPKRRIDAVGVVGAGTMGSGIAINFLQAGIPVVLLETRAEALERGVAAIRKTFEGQFAKGRLSKEALEQRMALLSPHLDYAALASVDLVIEAVFEDWSVKESVFRQIDAVARQGAILASNTSTLDLDRIAAFTSRPADVVGLHFFSPANVMKLLEVVRGAATAKDVLATAMAMARRIGKTAVVSGVCDGFIGNRMLNQYLRAAEDLLIAGANPQQVDRALEKWGMAMGPFRMTDMAGNDIGWAVRKRQYQENPGMRQSPLADRLCEAGRYGQKTGAGWYRYPPGRRDALPDPEVERLIAAHRVELGISPCRLDDEQIVERCVYALVTEGARLLEEGIALRASDIDMVYLTGYGFPLHRGGPMHYADEVGLYRVARTLRRWADKDGAFWQPAPLLARLAAQGGSFAAGERP